MKMMTVLLLLLMGTVTTAQEIKVGAMKFISSKSNPGFGSLIWAQGRTITKNGLEVAFQEVLKKDSIMVGYKFKASALDSILKNDAILIFIPRLKYDRHMQGFTSVCEDEGGNRVFGVSELDGAWKSVTISGKNKIPNKLNLAFVEECKLSDGSVINSIDFKLVNDFYVTDRLFKKP
jgi:hypothetical protein